MPGLQGDGEDARRLDLPDLQGPRDGGGEVTCGMLHRIADDLDGEAWIAELLARLPLWLEAWSC